MGLTTSPKECLVCLNSSETTFVLTEESQKIFNICCSYVKDAINIEFWMNSYTSNNSQLSFCKNCLDCSFNISQLVEQLTKLKKEIHDLSSNFSETIAKQRFQAKTNKGKNKYLSKGSTTCSTENNQMSKGDSMDRFLLHKLASDTERGLETSNELKVEQINIDEIGNQIVKTENEDMFLEYEDEENYDANYLVASDKHEFDPLGEMDFEPMSSATTLNILPKENLSIVRNKRVKNVDLQNIDSDVSENEKPASKRKKMPTNQEDYHEIHETATKSIRTTSHNLSGRSMQGPSNAICYKGTYKKPFLKYKTAEETSNLDTSIIENPSKTRTQNGTAESSVTSIVQQFQENDSPSLCSVGNNVSNFTSANNYVEYFGLENETFIPGNVFKNENIVSTFPTFLYDFRKFQHFVLKNQEQIIQNQRDIQSMLSTSTVQSTGFSGLTKKSNIPLLPLHSEVELDLFEECLLEENNRIEIINLLSRIGGSSTSRKVNKVLSRLFTHNFAERIRFTSKSGKLEFCSLRTKDIVRAAVQITENNSTDTQIDSMIATWFRNVKDRNGGRAVRKLNV